MSGQHTVQHDMQDDISWHAEVQRLENYMTTNCKMANGDENGQKRKTEKVHGCSQERGDCGGIAGRVKEVHADV